jgi:hypothetical protein
VLIQIEAPMGGEWERLMDEIQPNLKPVPLAVYLPSKVQDGTKTDADMLKILWRSLTDLGIPILNPK